MQGWMRAGMRLFSTRGRYGRTGGMRRLRSLGMVAVLVLLTGMLPRVGTAAAGASVPARNDALAGIDAPGAFSLPWTPPKGAYRVSVQADGIFALTYSDLADANLPIDTLDPRSLRMDAMGQEIPIRVLGEEDGHFDSGDVVLFYGRSVDSLFRDGVLPTNKYTAQNVYWLSYACVAGPCDGPYGLRMAEVDGAGAGDASSSFAHREHVERQFWYYSSYPFEDNADHWYADWVTVAVPRTYSFYAYHASTADGDASLRIKLLGWSDKSHHLRVWVNNNLVIDGSTGWSGFTAYETTVAVPAAYLVEGQNKVKVGMVLDAGVTSDTVYENWFDLDYNDTYVAESGELAFSNANAGSWRYDIANFTDPGTEVYNVSDPFAPQRVINTAVSGAGPYTVSFGDATTASQRYLAVQAAAWKKPASITRATLAGSVYQPVDLLSAGNSADYIVIAHHNFWSQAERIASFRHHDFRVALVDVQQIYDQFNGGMMSAESIHDFLAYAHAHWTAPAPMYVLLFGDGTNDMRKYRSTADTFIPPYLSLADPDLGETAAENRFVTFNGYDNVPGMHIGRFPVNTEAEAQAMVDKTINYEIGCSCNGAWDLNTLFVSDDLEGGGGDFYGYSNMIADGYADTPTDLLKWLPPEYNVTKAYLGQTCDVTGNPSDAAECRNVITTTLNNTGALFVSYIGHSTKEYWAAEHVFDKAAVDTLTNGPCLPIMLAMTCYEGSFFDYGTPNTLAEASVRMTKSGSVASFSPTGFGLVSGHDYLEKGLMEAWFQKGINRLGASITYAKQYLVDNAPLNSYRDLLDTFVLLGDPGLVVKTQEACLTPTGVLARSFSAEQARDAAGWAVRLAWQTADESDMLGFNVLRRQGPSGAFAPINAALIPADNAGTNRAGRYSYLDTSAQLGLTYQYTLEIIKLDGSHELFGSAESRLSGVRFFLPVLPGG